MAKVIHAQVFGVFGPRDIQTVNSWHYAYVASQAPSTDFLDALNTSLQGAGEMVARLAACCSSDWSAITLKLTHMGLQNVAPFWKEYNIIGFPGLLAPPTAPPQVTAVVRKRTGIAKRWGYGRVFVPMLPQGLITNGVVTAASALDSALSLLAQEQNVIYSQLVGGVNIFFIPGVIRSVGQDVDEGPLFTKVIDGQYDRTTRVQRRREVGVGI